MLFSKELLDSIRKANKIVVFTGAGASAESGIPTFRDALTGLWSRYDPMQLATYEAFINNPDLVWSWYEWRRALVSACSPNACHLAITQLQNRVASLTVITQNVDDLHERAGNKNIIRLHGSLHHPYCIKCHTIAKLPPVTLEQVKDKQSSPPLCKQCSQIIRPGVVWFGESLPVNEWKSALHHAAECDVLFSIGTSSMVQPAADIPAIAKSNGACIIQINPYATGIEPIVDFSVKGKSGEIFPKIIANL